MNSGKNILYLRGNFCHAFAMAKFKRLYDLYRFPGFVPQLTIRGVFGDPHAVVITLRRRRKKRFATSAAKHLGLATTSGFGASEISVVATSVSISSTSCAGSNVVGAGA
jgi:hypothetical protein